MLLMKIVFEMVIHDGGAIDDKRDVVNDNDWCWYECVESLCGNYVENHVHMATKRTMIVIINEVYYHKVCGWVAQATIIILWTLLGEMMKCEDYHSYFLGWKELLRWLSSFLNVLLIVLTDVK